MPDSPRGYTYFCNKDCIDLIQVNEIDFRMNKSCSDLFREKVVSRGLQGGVIGGRGAIMKRIRHLNLHVTPILLATMDIIHQGLSFIRSLHLDLNKQRPVCWLEVEKFRHILCAQVTVSPPLCMHSSQKLYPDSESRKTTASGEKRIKRWCYALDPGAEKNRKLRRSDHPVWIIGQKIDTALSFTIGK